MKMDIKDLASLISGATVIFNDCSVQFIVGGVEQGEEDKAQDSDYGATAIGFVHTPPEDEEEELEEEVS